MDVNDFCQWLAAGDDGAGLKGDSAGSLRLSTRRWRELLSSHSTARLPFDKLKTGAALQRQGISAYAHLKLAPSSSGIGARYSLAPHRSSSLRRQVPSASVFGYSLLEHAPSERALKNKIHEQRHWTPASAKPSLSRACRRAAAPGIEAKGIHREEFRAPTMQKSSHNILLTATWSATCANRKNNLAGSVQ